MTRRLAASPPDTLSPDALRLFEAITKGARSLNRKPEDFLDADGGLRGPFNAWLRTPKLGLTTQHLGEMLRFEGDLRDDLREVAILAVASHWRANYEWWAHAKIAAKAGVGDSDIARIKSGHAPSDHEAAVVHRFADLLAREGRVPDEPYREAETLLGEAGVVELVLLVGYYGMVAATLNAFEVAVPEGETLPFPETEADS